MMKEKFLILVLLSGGVLMTGGCSTPKNEFGDEREYSDMPWNTPQQWEGSRQLPGMAPQY
jgi:hypothetical protein